MAYKVVQIRRDTASNWTSNDPTLAEGEWAYETDTGKVKIGDGSTAWTSLAYSGGNGGGIRDYILITDQKDQGVFGGTFTEDAWQTRDLNTEVSDAGGHASVASNQITLAAGTYEFKISAPAVRSYSHQALLYNISDSSVVAYGTSEYDDWSIGYTCTRSLIQGRFVIGSPKIFEVRHKGNQTYDDYGFGIPGGMAVETYTVVEFWKTA